MDPNDLPVWLTSIQAIILLVTGDAALAAQAVPNATASKLHGHPDAIPVEEWTALCRRMTAERRRILQQYLEYTGSRPRRVQDEPLGTDQRAQLAGDASEWSDGFSLTNLAIRTGSWPEPHVKRLVESARSGKVATIDGNGNPIDSSVWTRHSMRETVRRPGVFVMVPVPYRQIDEDSAVEPLFSRDDVLRLGMAVEAPAPTGNATPTAMGGMSRGDEAVPDPDLQAQFDAEKRRRMHAGEDHRYDSMTLWARHNLQVDTDTAKELWAHRSAEFSRDAGRPKSEGAETQRKRGNRVRPQYPKTTVKSLE
jgi:hypothetical protein